MALALATLAGAAHADLAGLPAAPPEPSAKHQALIAENPILTELDGWLLAAILERVDRLPRDGGGPVSGFEGLGAFEVNVLGRNPALMGVWQASPEAAAELLALIKAAGGKQGKGPAGL